MGGFGPVHRRLSTARLHKMAGVSLTDNISAQTKVSDPAQVEGGSTLRYRRRYWLKKGSSVLAGSA